MAGRVEVFEDGGLRGSGQSFGLGKHDADVLKSFVGENAISSLSVEKGFRVRLYDDAGFKGNEVVFSVGDHELRACGWNDRASSVIVEKDDGCVTLYEHGSFTGKTFNYGMGYHDGDDIKNSIGDNVVSSVKVKEGYEVRLFENPGFNGLEVLLGPGDHDVNDLTLQGFENDALSSMIVQ